MMPRLDLKLNDDRFLARTTLALCIHHPCDVHPQPLPVHHMTTMVPWAVHQATTMVPWVVHPQPLGCASGADNGRYVYRLFSYRALITTPPLQHPLFGKHLSPAECVKYQKLVQVDSQFGV